MLSRNARMIIRTCVPPNFLFWSLVWPAECMYDYSYMRSAIFFVLVICWLLECMYESFVHAFIYFFNSFFQYQPYKLNVCMAVNTCTKVHVFTFGYFFVAWSFGESINDQSKNNWMHVQIFVHAFIFFFWFNFFFVIFPQ